MSSTHARTRRPQDPPPFIVSDAPVFDPFEPEVRQRRGAVAPSPRSIRVVMHLAFVGLLGLLALAQAPWWAHVVLGGAWVLVDRYA